jgi:Holliday junction resolvase RusA-like endonuclease
MKSVTFVVESVPPWKQAPADEEERTRQVQRKSNLLEKAQAVFRIAPLQTPCALAIRYSRCSGGPDAANIIGGVADALQGIIYVNDNQLHEISYVEWLGNRDWYQVTVTECAEY